MKTGEIEKMGFIRESSHDMVEKQIHPMHHGLWSLLIIKTSRIEILKYIIRNCEKVLWGVKDY